jgi:hypothetical protein
VDPSLLTTTPSRKLRVARLVAHTPLSAGARRWEQMRPGIRIFNLHSVPPRYEAQFERQVEHLAGRFRLARAEELESIVGEGSGTGSVAFFMFDDGLANHGRAAELLEQWDATALLAVPAAFPSDPGEAWFRTHVYPQLTELHTEPADIRPLSWEHLGVLAEHGHRVCSHGFDHQILEPDLSDDALHREIVESREHLEARLPGVSVDGFCWPGRYDTNATRAAKLIADTYAFSFGSHIRRMRGGDPLHTLPRVNIEASWPLELVDLQLSGVLDAIYAARGRRT